MGAPAIVLLQRSEREIVDHLRRAGATSPDRAVPLPELRHIARRRLRRLVNAQAVRETERGYWLDEPIYDAYRSDRRGLILLILGIAGAIALGLLVRELV